MPHPPRPATLERKYTTALLARQRAIHNVLMEEIDKALRKIGPGIDLRAEQAGRKDSLADDLARLLRVIDTVTLAVEKGHAPPEGVIGAIAAGADTFAGKALTRQVQSVYGVSVVSAAASEATLATWAEANVSLIRTIDSRYFAEIEGAVLDTLQTGKSTRSLTKLIEERYGVARSRAELIAVDQLGSLNGRLTEAKQVDAGIKGYKWSDSNDARVRPIHVLLNGTHRLWSDPHPTEGHPGSAIRCRCVAIPDFTAV